MTTGTRLMRTTALASAALLATAHAPARAGGAGEPAVIAPAPATAADRQADALLTAYMRTMGIPGLQLAVVRDGRVVAQRAYGRASLEFEVPVTHDPIFSINSVTKAFTGVAAMRLVETGQLALDAPIARYVDDLPAAWQPIPVRQLLTHMSGLPDLAVFTFIAARFPRSSNAHDSLGEALAANGDAAAAIAAYQRSVELDPGNTNATRQIARLRERR
jgi:CubicO group peptidase (beta-lactamase class C family)